MSGLFAGLMLQRNGWDVDIYEKVEGELAGRGAGIVAQPELQDQLRGIGLDVGADLGVVVEIRKTFAQDGSIIAEYPCRQIMTSWDRVYRMLRHAFLSARYHNGWELRGIDQDASGVTAHFSNGKTESADLLVGADGIRSSVRQVFLPELPPTYAGYVAWRGLIDESAFQPATRDAVFDDFVFCLPPGEQFLGYPVAGLGDDLRPGHRRYNFVWYRPALEANELPRMLTDAGGHVHTLSIPPPLIDSQIVREMREAGERLLPPQLREVLSACALPFLQPIYDLETPRMAFGRVAILGDAAFVARPHVGAGVAKAAEDALALAVALRDSDVEPALHHFDAERNKVGRTIIAHARHLGTYLQSQPRSAEERALAERHGDPKAVMAETALLDFLHE